MPLHTLMYITFIIHTSMNLKKDMSLLDRCSTTWTILPAQDPVFERSQLSAAPNRCDPAQWKRTANDGGAGASQNECLEHRFPRCGPLGSRTSTYGTVRYEIVRNLGQGPASGVLTSPPAGLWESLGICGISFPWAATSVLPYSVMACSLSFMFRIWS
jgi:hypothetical protein